jgi:hypothetical protein
MLNKNGLKVHFHHELHQLLPILQLRVLHVRLHLDGGEVKYSDYQFGYIITCLNLSSGGATIGLVAEVTGLTGNRFTKWVRNTRQTRQLSGLKILNDIIRTSYRSSS